MKPQPLRRPTAASKSTASTETSSARPLEVLEAIRLSCTPLAILKFLGSGFDID
jgi:hypothetical protein